jgi:hypothetical protein
VNGLPYDGNVNGLRYVKECYTSTRRYVNKVPYVSERYGTRGTRYSTHECEILSSTVRQRGTVPMRYVNELLNANGLMYVNAVCERGMVRVERGIIHMSMRYSQKSGVNTQKSGAW